MEQQHVTPRQACSETLQLGFAHSLICPGRHRDRVLATFLHQDQGGAGRLLAVSRHARDVDTLLLQASQQFLTEVVAPDTSQQANPGTKPGGRHRLVRTFAARKAQQPVAEHGVARKRQGPHPHHEIEVDAAEDGHRAHDKTFCGCPRELTARRSRTMN